MNERPRHNWPLTLGLCAVVAGVGCVGQVGPGAATDPAGGLPGPGSPGAGGSSGSGPGGNATGGSGGSGPLDPGVTPLAGPPTRSAGARRLTRDELARSLQRLLGADVPVDVNLLPEDTLTPFDNDVLEQSPSMRLVESMEAIARDVADWVTASPARMARVVPCTPSGADAACFGQFVDGFGRRVLRHPLDAETAKEMRELVSYAQPPGSFATAVNAALRVFLMHPEFLYRLEPGQSQSGGRVTLTGYEIAARLSFLLQGTTPDDVLLAAAEAGTLRTPAGRAAEARRLLAADEGKQQVRRFHAFWFGYAALDELPIHGKLRAESDALIDRASAAGADYRQLLLSDETRIDGELASHYGLPASGTGFTWVNYGAAPRRGILAHGMFAAAGSKFTDTSPTRRGKFIRERLLCQTVPLPPPGSAVDVDLPPQGKTANACKTERYRQHREDAECAGCHALMDPIGFGLENFDQLGRFRSHEADRPDCPIDGVGALDPATPFTGARELATLIAESPALSPCLGEHFLRFAVGRGLDDQDRRRARWLGDQLGADFHLTDMILAYVGHDNFGVRDE